MILIYVLLYILITALIIYYLYSILNDSECESFTSYRYIENKVLPSMLNNKFYYIIDRQTNQCLTYKDGMLQMQPYNKNNTANQQWNFKKLRLSHSAVPYNYRGLQVRNNVLRYRAGEYINDSNLIYQYAINYQFRNLSPYDSFLIQQKNKNNYIYFDNRSRQFKLSNIQNTGHTLNLKGIRYETRVGWYWAIRYIVQPFRWFLWFLSRIFYRVFSIRIQVPYFYTVAIPYYLDYQLNIDNCHEFSRFIMKNYKLGYVENNQSRYIQIDNLNRIDINTDINKVSTQWYIVEAVAIERYLEDNKPNVANKEFKKSIHKSVTK